MKERDLTRAVALKKTLDQRRANPAGGYGQTDWVGTGAEPMTSPADKATDDVRGMVERLLEPCVDCNGEQIVDDSTPRHEVHCRLLREAAATLTSLLERAELAEHRAEELADGLMYVTVDHTGCIYTTADEDAAIKLAKDNLAAAIEAERTARERAETRIKELEQERDDA